MRLSKQDILTIIGRTFDIRSLVNFSGIILGDEGDKLMVFSHRHSATRWVELEKRDFARDGGVFSHVNIAHSALDDSNKIHGDLHITNKRVLRLV